MAKERPGAIDAIMSVPVRRWPGAQHQVACGEMGVRAAIEGNDRIVLDQITDGFDHHLRPERRKRRPFDVAEQAVPARHAVLRLLKKSAVRLMTKQREERRERRFGVADEADFDRIAQADPVRLRVDLHATRLPRLRVIFEPRHG